jgi:hypothetical protein
MKKAVYEIPVADTTIDSSSKCDNEQDNLKVNFGGKNSFELIFNENTTSSTYDLSSFKISLDTSNIFNDSAGT